AVAGESRSMVLDEAASSLDAGSEAIVRAALMRATSNRTAFVIAHRLSAILGASKIVGLDKGCIVEVGTHEELMERGRLYPELYRRQFGQDRAVLSTGLASGEA